MSKLLELRKKAADVAGRIAKVRDEYNARKKDNKTGAELWSEDHNKQWRSLNEEYDSTKAEIEQAEREDELEGRAAASAEWLAKSQRDGRQKPGTDDLGDDGRTYGERGAKDRDEANAMRRSDADRRMAFQAWAAHGVRSIALGDEHREACARMKFDPSVNEVHGSLLDTSSVRSIQSRLRSVHPDLRERAQHEIMESRALSGLTGATGGYLSVPSSTVRALEMAMISFGSHLAVAETITTETGEEMGWPVGDDTSNEGEYVDENTDAQDSGEPNPGFESVVLRSYDLSSKFIKVPYSLARDSFVNLDVVVGAMCGERLGRKLAREATLGTAKIRGIIPRAATGRTAAGATAITYADATGLEHSVDPALRDGSRFMFHDSILEKLRLLVDSQNRPLWLSNIREGVPDTFNGRQYVINQFMDGTVATTKKTMAFGRLEYYKWRRVGLSLRIKRLVERFAEKDQVGYIAYMSGDGNLLRPKQTAACPVKLLVQP